MAKLRNGVHILAHSISLHANGDRVARTAQVIQTHGHGGSRRDAVWHSKIDLEVSGISRRIAEVQKTLDHKLLNRIEALGPPTLENLSRFIWERLQPVGHITRVSVHRDSCNEGCTYFGPQD